MWLYPHDDDGPGVLLERLVPYPFRECVLLELVPPGETDDGNPGVRLFIVDKERLRSDPARVVQFTLREVRCLFNGSYEEGRMRGPLVPSSGGTAGEEA